jgi:hypothetical protein
MAEGGHVLVGAALSPLAVGARLAVQGTDAELVFELAAWARARGHRCEGATVVKGQAAERRWHDAERAGAPDAPCGQADPGWGLAPRGSLVEAGGRAWAWADLVDRQVVWSDAAPRLYEQALGAQWDPSTAIDWNAPMDHAEEIEDAVVQVMTYLVENELAALVLPTRFISRIHPHFREVVQLLAVQAADEARHVEVFTRRALLHRQELGSSGAGGRASLGTLFEEPEYSVASFLLSVLGEGTFLQLLSFLEAHGPDPVTRGICRLVRQDEARHVATAMGHLGEQAIADPDLRRRLAAAVRRRHDSLASTAGLNADVFDALVLVAAGSFSPDDVRSGFAAVAGLVAEMDEARRRRLQRLGFSVDEAAELSALHTRNFM